jgi:hypothetical protein
MSRSLSGAWLCSGRWPDLSRGVDRAIVYFLGATRCPGGDDTLPGLRAPEDSDRHSNRVKGFATRCTI